MATHHIENAVCAVHGVVKKYRTKRQWHDKTDAYWLARLQQEVGELASALVGDHEDTPEHELQQIASIAINWLGLRYKRGGGMSAIKSTGFIDNEVT